MSEKQKYNVAATIYFDVHYQVEASSKEEAEEMAHDMALDEHTLIDPDSLFCRMDSFEIYNVTKAKIKERS